MTPRWLGCGAERERRLLALRYQAPAQVVRGDARESAVPTWIAAISC